jgi:hypothetical protein
VTVDDFLPVAWKQAAATHSDVTLLSRFKYFEDKCLRPVEHLKFPSLEAALQLVAAGNNLKGVVQIDKHFYASVESHARRQVAHPLFRDSRKVNAWVLLPRYDPAQVEKTLSQVKILFSYANEKKLKFAILTGVAQLEIQ